MKARSFLLTLSLIVLGGFAQAGGFGGPPPFTNGSPLVTGIDGSYQASARGKNLSGVFRFTYSNQTQSSTVSDSTVLNPDGILSDPGNDYVFFVNGVTYRGLTQASITQSHVSGVFDNGAANIANLVQSSGGSTFGVGLTTFMSGYFDGDMDLEAGDSFFEGDGTVVVLDEITETIPGETTQDPGTGQFDIPLGQYTQAVNFLSVQLGITTAEAIAMIGAPTYIPPSFSTSADSTSTFYTPTTEVEIKFSGTRLNTGT